MKKAFTLSEVLITILIIGIIAAVTIPALQKAYPDKLETMRRKSYYILEQTVSQMYSDDTMYPPKTATTNLGFRNTEKVNLNGKDYEGKSKFCQLFADALNKRADSVTKCEVNAKSFTSADNIDWYLPFSDFSDGYAAIKFDVNGKADPNCEYNATECPKPDTFTYYVTSEGRILKQAPDAAPIKYCIYTNITGSGSVSPSAEYCNLSNGTYTLTATPASGWVSNWSNNKREVRINNSDKTVSVVFTEGVNACVELNVNCPTGTPDKCGSYSISSGSFTTDGNVLKACDLITGDYTITVTPKSTHTSDWTSKTVSLNGIDQSFNVNFSENKYCAILTTNCPDGGANICATYKLTGGGETYGMDTTGTLAKNCSLKPGSYTLTITPLSTYVADKTSITLNISSSDWEGTVTFTK